MRKLMFIFISGFLIFLPVLAESRNPEYKKLKLTDKFYCEGAYYGDFNKDGQMDVVSGPFWYEGPGFKKKHLVKPVQEFEPLKYSDNFLTFTDDFNNDNWIDIFYMPWPGKEGSWYENPGDADTPWKKHTALEAIDNESPFMTDVDGDGIDDLLCNYDKYFGYAVCDPNNPDKKWTFYPITPKGNYKRYTHGLGFGDVNGDGRNDLVEKEAWWEQPAGFPNNKKTEWKKHEYPFGEAPSQMHVYDIDGDGLNDIVTSWHCHKYGLLWYKQIKEGSNGIGWRKNVILPPEPTMEENEFRFSQMHAIIMVDMNKDGLKDILTGKRFWAHGQKKDPEPNAPAVLYWFELKRGPGNKVSFIPHLVDDDSGVGCQVAACDLNNDNYPDIIVGNKKGTFVFLSK